MLSKAIMALIIVIISPSIINAQSIPAGHIYNENREFWIDSAGLTVALTIDAISTQQTYNRCPSCKEIGLLYPGSRDTGKIMTSWAVIDMAAIVGSYEWKAHVHNKWLHPLWRVPLIIGMSGHSKSAIDNWKVR